jgi:hypothetical protein
MNYQTPTKKHDPKITKAGTTLEVIDLKGKPYLQVAQRLVWFREEHADWSIETELKQTEGGAMALATIKNEDGRVIAMAHKVEHKQHFGDFVEKAETGAIGRALALCGYGTQYEPELDEGDRIVDSPVTPAKKAEPTPKITSDYEGVTDNQIRFIAKLYEELGKPAPETTELSKMSKHEASALIDSLTEEKSLLDLAV